ncbi:MAG TPA: response regulator [Burkholderiales bacterium]|nr:response regulator [Burkholderiales bacterium]
MVMRDFRGVRVARKRAPDVSRTQIAPDRAAVHSALCVVPKRLRSNPLRPLLPGYALAAVESWAAALRLARHTPYDVYIVCSPLGWSEPIEICRRIRNVDPQTPIVVFASDVTLAERRAALASGCVQAFVARSDDAHNLGGTVGQLVMLAELRSMDAMKRGIQAMEEHIGQRLARLQRRAPKAPPAARTQTRLKVEACRIFGAAGGSRANFERLWPSIYESALKRVRKPGA